MCELIKAYSSSITLENLTKFCQRSLEEHPEWKNKPVFFDCLNIVGELRSNPKEGSARFCVGK